MSSKKIKAYCMDWHLTKSDAFIDMLIEPMRGRIDIELVSINKYKTGDSKDPVIFCQVEPPAALLNNADAKVAWLPMWDSIAHETQEWWNNLPKHLRVVCFSRAVCDKVTTAGLPYLKLAFFKNPADFPEIDWQQRRLFYWNRTGLIVPDFLRKLCELTRADERIFMSTLDPGISKGLFYSLPKKLSGTIVRQVDQTNRDEFFRVTSGTNLFVAPRALEGVGMTFLEAMARGAAVMAYDGPTMNEYIDHKENGYLFNNLASRKLHKRGIRFAKRFTGSHPKEFILPLDQSWSEIYNLDWERLGKAARQDHIDGYSNLQNSLDDYAQFISSW